MALTFTVSDLVRQNIGSARLHTGTITCSGTNSDDGDAITAAALGLNTIVQLSLEPALDSTSNPENAFLPVWRSAAGKVVFYTAHGTPGGAVPLLQVTDATTLTDYAMRFSAVGN